MSAYEAEEYVDERFFRVPTRSSYGTEMTTSAIKYWSKRSGLFGGNGICILELLWQDELDRARLTTRDELCRVYKDLKKAEAARSEAYKSVRPFLLSKIFGDDPTWKEVWTWDHEYSYRVRRLIAHLVETCAVIAALERKGQLPVQWTQYTGIIPSSESRDPKAPRQMTTYPFLLCREGQRLLETLTVPLEHQLGHVMGRICLEAKLEPAFSLGKSMEVEGKGREKELEAMKEQWRGWLSDLLRRRGERDAEPLPAYEAVLPVYDEAKVDK